MAEKQFDVSRTSEEWQQTLTPEQFQVLREHGTERPGSSPLNVEKRDGTFVCAGCGQPLFSSETKFESGTGWPSFWAPFEDAVETTTDQQLRDDARSRCTANVAAAIWATCFRTAPRRPAIATA